MKTASTALLSKASLLGFAASLMIMTGACTAAGDADTEAASSEDNADLMAQADDAPLILRRQTLIVRDIDRSLALYRDAMGMEIIYDNTWSRPHKTEDRDQTIRLVFLKASDPFIGILGLVDYESDDPDHPSHSKPLDKQGFVPGKTVTLFNTTELEKRWPMIEKVPGVDVINGPKLTEYPGYGDEVIKINVTRFYDPDGFLVEYNQPLQEGEE